MSKIRNIYVIMASYLGQYDGAATDRPAKFVRAVNSFLQNKYEPKKLIIVADGCTLTREFYEKRFLNNEQVELISINKQPLFSGNVRQAAIEHINKIGTPDDIICYLDSDDMFADYHLAHIVKFFDENDWVYFNDYWHYNKNKIELRNTVIEYSRIGTSCIAHLNKPEFNWKDCNGYGHDFKFIQRLMDVSKKYSRIRGCGYFICHIMGVLES